MTDYRTDLDHDLGRVAPATFTLGDVIRRRDRKRRNQRILAGSVGVAVFVAAVWIVLTVGSLDRTRTDVPGGDGTGPALTGPITTGPVGPTLPLGPVTDQDIALGEVFASAWIEGDGEAAAAQFGPEATFDGFPPGILAALHDWFRAGGWTFEAEGSHPCGLGGYGQKHGYVGCGFVYENDLTRALGLQPQFLGVHFVTDAGAIKTAKLANIFNENQGSADLFGDVWDSFVGWLSTRAPDDFVRMYDTDRGFPILDPTSIELWERYTDEFAAALPGSFTEWLANQSLEVRARRICVTKSNEFWATDPRGGGFSVAVADVSEEILAELRALHIGTEADRATMDAFVPLAERWIEFFRQGEEGPTDPLPKRKELQLRKELQFSMSELIDGCLIPYGFLG